MPESARSTRQRNRPISSRCASLVPEPESENEKDPEESETRRRQR
nr:unnamed protein product [Callosobruchus analis]